MHALTPRCSPCVVRITNRMVDGIVINCETMLRHLVLDHVFPGLLEQLPDAQLVIAGANPPEFLKARASPNIAITLYVEDLNREIAQRFICCSADDWKRV